MGKEIYNYDQLAQFRKRFEEVSGTDINDPSPEESSRIHQEYIGRATDLIRTEIGLGLYNDIPLDQVYFQMHQIHSTNPPIAVFDSS
jgi:hypothetical protein